jgi:membrane protease YdiL (CAAX protease family)
MFSVAHLYQGRRGLISTFVLGLIFAASRLWVGNLVPAVAGHLAVDMMAGYLGPRYLKKNTQDQVSGEPGVAAEDSESSARKV